MAVIRRRRARIGSWVIRAVGVIWRSEGTTDHRAGDHTGCNRSAPSPAPTPLNLLDGRRRSVFDRQGDRYDKVGFLR
jgi:hypothetical protein